MADGAVEPGRNTATEETVNYPGLDLIVLGRRSVLTFLPGTF